MVLEACIKFLVVGLFVQDKDIVEHLPEDASINLAYFYSGMMMAE